VAGVGFAGRIIDLAISIPLGAGVFYLMALALRVSELEAAWNSIGKPMMRKLGMKR
jgi:hypothetical protein